MSEKDNTEGREKNAATPYDKEPGQGQDKGLGGKPQYGEGDYGAQSGKESYSDENDKGGYGKGEADYQGGEKSGGGKPGEDQYAGGEERSYKTGGDQGGVEQADDEPAEGARKGEGGYEKGQQP